MALQTIPRGIEDPWYRYKMPPLTIKVESKGNGIKTVITNMVEVSKALGRPPTYLTKFFGFELGTITSVPDSAHGKYIVNGDHDQPKLMRILDDFIDKFIVCKRCAKNPETYIIIHDDLIDLRCASCGGTTHVDMGHKLSGFILKNPPPPPPPDVLEKLGLAPAKKTPGGKKKEKQGDEKKDGKVDAKEKGDDSVVWHTDTSKEAADQRRKAMLDETSELAAKLLGAGISAAESADPLVSMHSFLSATPPPSSAQILAQLKKEKEEYKLDDEQTARLTFLALFDSNNLFKQIQAKDKLYIVKKVVTNTAGQTGLLAGFTELAKKESSVLAVVPHVLKHFYDHDVLEEDVIVKWYYTESMARGRSKKVKEAAKTFVDWLETAEEEDSE